ncbi:MAG: phosphoribosylformylglycinamidine synthase subunit PurL [Phycisphaerales bacterium]|nr:MAG: phosphoribosylformylglycinamidine synthase subunit PurL [Phycisphaerales bacterium]
MWQVQVVPRGPDVDPLGRQCLADVRQIPSLSHVRQVRSSGLYFLRGRLDEQQVERIAGRLLADAVVQTYTVRAGMTRRDPTETAIEVHYQPGVMDAVALSAAGAIADLLQADGATSCDAAVEVRTARRYVIDGANGVDDLERIARRVLANDCIESVYIQGFGRSDPLPSTFPTAPGAEVERKSVAIRALDRDGLVALSRQAHLFLSADEMQAIRDHFAGAGRDPTDLELETLAQTWSEHCVHKTLTSDVVYRGAGFGGGGQVEVRFENLLKSTIAEVTRRLNRDWCLSVFKDNAGVVEFDDEYGIAFKVETHNHPSAIEPYGGAATGIGGCIRDILGCGLGAKPIANTDIFCFAPPDFADDRLPKGVLHPQRIFKGVVSGVRDYGNRMGIPTVNGAILFDERYLANPLVFCGCVGLIPKSRIGKEPKPGDRIVLVGGRTGRDGIHGATFSSAELTDTHADEFSHAVQIGNAIEEKKVLDALLLARDHPSGCLFNAVTDCGAGGLSSAVGEMGESIGAVVDLEKVPLKYAGLRYDEIWISEAQERMVFAVPPGHLETLLAVFGNEHVEATVIGEFANDGVLRVRYHGTTVGELDMRFLHHGRPRATREAVWHPEARPAPDAARSSDVDLGRRVLQALADPNVASKEWVIRQYDHEVQGATVVKPLCGPGDGPSDAAVIRPRLHSRRGIAIGCGLCPGRRDGDPYWMAVAAVDEALRNVVCVGADPGRTSILDNFCWPAVDDAESLGALVRACAGAHDAALAFGLPFISGKDSLNNQFSQSPQEARRCGLPERISIPDTLLISSLGMVDDVSRCVTMDLKEPGSALVVIAAPGNQVGLDAAGHLHRAVADWIAGGNVLSAHDVSDGGLAVAVAEMCIAGGLGADITPDVWGDDDPADVLFDEPLTTYVIECQAEALDALSLPGPAIAVIGEVVDRPRLTVKSGPRTLVDLAVEDLSRAWRSLAP